MEVYADADEILQEEIKEYKVGLRAEAGPVTQELADGELVTAGVHSLGTPETSRRKWTAPWLWGLEQLPRCRVCAWARPGRGRAGS